MTSTTTELSLDEIFNLAKTALINNGANEENADAVATTVTNAERDGSVSHGLFRIPGYIKALQSNTVVFRFSQCPRENQGIFWSHVR